MFEWTEEQKLVRKMLRKWTTQVLEPKVTDLENGEPPYELMRQFAKVFDLGGIAKTTREKLIASQSGDGSTTGKGLSLPVMPPCRRW